MSFNPALTENRLNDAIFLRRLHVAIEQDLKENAVIGAAAIEEYKHGKTSKLIADSMENEKKLRNNWFDCNDMFNLLFDKYNESLDNAGMDWLKFVPVKEGEILQKHFLIEGDGSMKINRARCAYPKEFYQRDHEGMNNAKNGNLIKHLQCNESPQKGNKSSTSFSTCSKHTKKMKSIGCPLNKINLFCKYMAIKRANEKKNSEKNQKKLESFKLEDVKLFNKIIDLYLNNKPKRTTYYKTRANINECLQYENDECTLTEFERICSENNINPLLINNPQC